MLEAKLPPPSPSSRRYGQHNPERSLGLRHEIGERKRGEEKHCGAEDGPIAAAEYGGSEGVQETGQRTDQSWQRYELKELVRSVMKAGLGQLHCHDAPEQPDRKAEKLGCDRPDEIAAGDVFTCRLPEPLILWVPVRNPASVPAHQQHAPLRSRLESVV